MHTYDKLVYDQVKVLFLLLSSGQNEPLYLNTGEVFMDDVILNSMIGSF